MTTFHSLFAIGYEDVHSGAEGVRAIDPTFRVSSLHQKMTDEDRKVFAVLVNNFAEEHLGARIVPRYDHRGTALALTGYKPRKDEAIQWDQPLYDSEGYEHCLAHLGAVEVVTKHSFTYSVWDRKTGVCRRDGCTDLTISNTPMSQQERASRREEGERLYNEMCEQAGKDSPRQRA